MNKQVGPDDEQLHQVARDRAYRRYQHNFRSARMRESDLTGDRERQAEMTWPRASGVTIKRGANMGILRCDHPDILEFITVKQDLTKVTNFNISVAITDAFMQAVHDDAEYDLINPRTGEPQLASREGLKHPLTGEVLVQPGQPMRLRARMVFDLIVQCAHATGEPGLFFVDRANEYNPVPQIGEYEATNPLNLAA